MIVTTYAKYAPAEADNPQALRRKMVAALLLSLIEPALTEIGWRPSQSEFAAMVDRDTVAVEKTLRQGGIPFDLFVTRVRANVPDLEVLDDESMDIVQKTRIVIDDVLKVMHRQARRRIDSAPTEREAAPAAASDRKD